MFGHRSVLSVDRSALGISLATIRLLTYRLHYTYLLLGNQVSYSLCPRQLHLGKASVARDIVSRFSTPKKQESTRKKVSELDSDSRLVCHCEARLVRYGMRCPPL